MRRCCRTLGEPGLDCAWRCALLYYLLLVSKHAQSLHISPLMCWGATPKIPAPLTPCWCAPPADTGSASKWPTLLSPMPQKQNQGVDVGGKAQPPCLHDGLWLSQACIDLFIRMCTQLDSVKPPGLHQSSCALSSIEHHSPTGAQPGLLLRTSPREDQDVWGTEVLVRLSP